MHTTAAAIGLGFVMPKWIISLLVFGFAFCGTSLHVQSQSLNSAAPQPTVWDHNGSVVYLVARGSSREFYYKEPRPGMLEAGARPGSLLFRGTSEGGRYVGTAFIFDRRCGQFPYQVSGPILDDYERVVLTGQAPRVGANCSIRGYLADTLEFKLLKASESVVTQIPAGTASTGEALTVELKTEGGTFTVPVLINNAITLDFIVDSGASDVSVPADVVMTLSRTGTVQKSDFIGQQTYTLADGSTVPSETFRIRSLTVGKITLENIVGSVAPAAGALLLGQSFLSRFRSWSIDNSKERLVLVQ
jgi:clan AA aspartic protease (TIGR02281 family)